MRTERADEFKLAHKWLRKVLAGRGKLTANFFFVGTPTLSDTGLLTTLSAKDKTGRKVERSGKELRKTIKRAEGSIKFAKGVITFTDRKLTFDIYQGTAPVPLLRKAFKQIGKEKFQGFKMGYLLKAIIRKIGEDGAVEDEVGPDPEDGPAELTEEEILEMAGDALGAAEAKWLALQQPALSTMMSQLQGGFLSAEAMLADIEEDVQTTLSSIEDLEAQLATAKRTSDSDAVLAIMEKLHQQRTDLAENSAFLGNPVREQELDEVFQRTIELAFDASSSILLDRLRDLRRESEQTVEEMRAGTATYTTVQLNQVYDEYEKAMVSLLEQGKQYRMQFPKPEELSESQRDRFAELDAVFRDQFGEDLADMAEFVVQPSFPSDAPISQEDLADAARNVGALDDLMAQARAAGDKELVKKYEKALERERAKLVEAIAYGPDPFSDGVVDEAFLRALEGAFDANTALMIKQLLALRAEANTTLAQLGEGTLVLTEVQNTQLWDDYWEAAEAYLNQAAANNVQHPTSGKLAPRERVEALGNTLKGLEEELRIATVLGDKTAQKAIREKLAAQRSALAQEISSGEDPFELGVGERVDEEFLRTLEASFDATTALMLAGLLNLRQDARDTIERIRTDPPDTWNTDTLGEVFDQFEEAVQALLDQAAAHQIQYPKPSPVEQSVASLQGIDNVEHRMFQARSLKDSDAVKKHERELAEYRKKLAESIAYGEDPFELLPNGSIDVDYQRTLEGSFDATTALMIKALRDLRDEWVETVEQIRTGALGTWTPEDLEELGAQYEVAVESLLSTAAACQIQYPTANREALNEKTLGSLSSIEEALARALKLGDSEVVKNHKKRLAEERRALAASIASGVDPFEALAGSEVDKAFMRTLEGSFDLSNELLVDELIELRTALGDTLEEISAQAASMSREEFEQRIDDLFESYQEMMDDLLQQAETYSYQFAV